VISRVNQALLKVFAGFHVHRSTTRPGLEFKPCNLAACVSSKGNRRHPQLAAPTHGATRQQGENFMPLIQVRVIKDVFSKEQKRQIISKLTDAMVSIEGEAVRGYTLCLVEEIESGDWGVGGNALTTADVHALARGKAA
jgi:4-oxalocrotonate tautomerase